MAFKSEMKRRQEKRSSTKPNRFIQEKTSFRFSRSNPEVVDKNIDMLKDLFQNWQNYTARITAQLPNISVN